MKSIDKDLLKRIDAKIQLVEKSLEPLQEELSSLRRKRLEANSTFDIGDVIKWGKFKGRVVAISNWACGDPMWTVQSVLKDGSLGSNRSVRSYNNPTIATE